MSSQSDSSPDPQLFHCPTCGASLPVPDAATVKCQYCGSNVLVPAEFRPQEPAERPPAPQPVMVQMPSQPIIVSQATGRSLRWIVAIVVILVVLGAVIPVVLAIAGIFAASELVSSSIQDISTAQAPAIFETTRQPTATPVPTDTPIPAASIALQFGGQGSGLGQFDDARSIAVDLDGNLYVAEYRSGRLQKFDSTGKFLQLINVEADSVGNTHIHDLAADYQGRLLVVRAADILIFNAADGALLDTIAGKFPDTVYSALAIDLANNIYAISDAAHSTDLIKFDPSGEIIWRQDGFATQLDKNAPFTFGGLAADGLGYTYIVNRNGAQVYKFNPDGQYVDRFGSKGREAGQLNNPNSIAVDAKGRLFIVDTPEIDAFDSDGNYLDTIPRLRELGVIRDITFDAQGNLYLVTTNGEVVKLTLNV